ncbi:MAG TPA: dipicolinate synthase subunit DpsA, partial [Bacillus sp. (in: firmicutes)]|nr:dipicolinate synthase subunit DpsA [Bacillus sp. (in: firmicutes)]
MLTNMQIAVIGGDARQLEIIRKLIEMDVKLSLIGFEQLDHAFSGATKEKIAEINFSQIDAIILPVAGTSL